MLFGCYSRVLFDPLNDEDDDYYDDRSSPHRYDLLHSSFFFYLFSIPHLRNPL